MLRDLCGAAERLPRLLLRLAPARRVDDSWRPDLSGVMIGFEATPGAAHGDSAVNLIVTGGEAVARSDYFAGLAASFVDGGTATFLVRPPGPRLVPYNVYLSLLLAEAARNLQQVKAVIAECYAVLKAQPPVAATPDQLGVVRTVRPAPRPRVRVSWSQSARHGSTHAGPD